MLKIIYFDFVLDLSNYDITIVEENKWFSDSFFTFSTLPFSFKITDELNAAFGDLLSYNVAEAETYFEVYFYHQGKEFAAIFEIEEIEDRDATGSVRFGMEELPNYNKKISELNLDDFEIEAPQTIYTHAANVITKTWPEVTHNFVQVHTDAFDDNTDQWAAFKGVINRRESGVFTPNFYDVANNLQMNENVMMPQPYLFHVLEKAVLDAGFTMAGDFLEDADFKKSLFSEISDYYYTINTDSKQLFMHNQEPSVPAYTAWSPVKRFEKTIVLTEKGRYKIAGNVTVRRYAYFRSSADIDFNNNRIWFTIQHAPRTGRGMNTSTHLIDLNVDFFTGNTAVIKFWTNNMDFDVIDGEFDTTTEAVMCDLTITQLSKMDASGNLLPTLVTPNHIKLAKCVPDITVGDFIKQLRNWKNLDIFPDGKVLYFNYIESQLNATNVMDFRDFEIKNPRRLYSKGKTFSLKFQEVSNEFNYLFNSIYVDVNGSAQSDLVNTDTSEIIINAIPLPVILRNNTLTAHHFLEDKTKIKVILFQGASGINNVAEDVSNILIPKIYETNFANWLQFRIHSQGFIWNFKMDEAQLQELNLRQKLFAYGNEHIIKSLNKDLLRPGLWYVEIETASLKHRVE